jgi:hypothetical protein
MGKWSSIWSRKASSVFINLEVVVFEGGSYFHVGLYMQPWKENFSPEKETFKKVSV